MPIVPPERVNVAMLCAKPAWIVVLISSIRANGASNANTLSTNDDSSRLSATSTAASSLDNGHDGPSQLREGPAREVSLPPIPKSISAFSLRAAGRTFSFGRAKAHTPPPTRTVPSTPIVRSSTSNDLTQLRQRAVTTSSYASTATPPDLDDKDLSLNLGGDFSSMFTDFGNRTSGAGASSSFGGMLGAVSAMFLGCDIGCLTGAEIGDC